MSEFSSVKQRYDFNVSDAEAKLRSLARTSTQSAKAQQAGLSGVNTGLNQLAAGTNEAGNATNALAGGMKLSSDASKLYSKSTYAVYHSLYLVAPQATGAARAIRGLTMALLATPWGLVAAGVAAVAGGLLLLSRRSGEASKARKEWQAWFDVQAEGLTTVNKLNLAQGEFNELLKEANDERLAEYEKRARAAAQSNFTLRHSFKELRSGVADWGFEFVRAGEILRNQRRNAKEFGDEISQSVTESRLKAMEFAKSIDTIRDSLDKNRVVTRQYADAQADLNNAWLQGELSWEEFNKLSAGILREHRKTLAEAADQRAERAVARMRGQIDDSQDSYIRASQALIGDFHPAMIKTTTQMVEADAAARKNGEAQRKMAEIIREGAKAQRQRNQEMEEAERLEERMAVRRLMDTRIGEVFGAGVRPEDDPVVRRTMMVNDALALAGQGFRSFSDIGGQAFALIASGSEGALKSLKELAAGELMSMSAQMAGRAIMEGAMAIAALARGNPASAAAHGKAAAMFALGAGATGASARLFGGSGSSARGTSAGISPTAGRGPAIGGGTGGGTTVIVGNDWSNQSPRQRAAQIESELQRARRLGEGESGVRDE